LAVVTLAGAAEEILGSLIKRKDEAAMIDHLMEVDKRLTASPYTQVPS
jgi:hypothetical protein